MLDITATRECREGVGDERGNNLEISNSHTHSLNLGLLCLYEENKGLRLQQFLLSVEFVSLKDWHGGVDWINIGREEILVGLEGLDETSKKCSR